MATFRIKRIYEPFAEEDGFRVLVDRLWPRGISKDRANIDLWLKDLSPSDALRRQYHGLSQTDADAWQAFLAAYAQELTDPRAQDAATQLQRHLNDGPVTLLYAARDEQRNNAAALQSWLERP